MNIKELSKRKELFLSGHRLCAGCGAGIAARLVMLAASKHPVVVVNATGCLEVTSTIFPYSAWATSWFHSLFENAGAVASGVEAAYISLKKQGRIKKDMRIIAIGGDGAFYDIGFQSLSGLAERGHKVLMICYNNEAYMNTGIQRSSATPKGASTTTSPVGCEIRGKTQFRKDLTACIAAHDIPYVAQASIGNWADLVGKVEKALEVDGPSFINIYSPCQLGWGFDPKDTVRVARLASETCYWPLYEIIDGKYKINFKPGRKKPLSDFFKMQKRFSHLNGSSIGDLQKHIDVKWKKLLSREDG